MKVFFISLIIVVSLLVVALLVALICFFMVFYSPASRKKIKEEYPIPEGEIYEPYREQMIQWIQGVRAMEHLDVAITSHDGLKLTGKYYEYKKGAPIEILFHGYKGTAERDLSGAVYRCFALERNALIVDHRASGGSEGRVITFGVKESRDCLAWIDFAINSLDPNAQIIITGISMGASTVMIASSKVLPTNVVAVLADCGYTSAKAIIKKVIRDMKLPADLLYPFVKLGAKLFGGFDPDAESPIESMKNCKLPIIFYHGDADDFVPYLMSEENYNACISPYKRLVITPNVGHGLCFPGDQEGYFKAAREFFEPILNA